MISFARDIFCSPLSKLSLRDNIDKFNEYLRVVSLVLCRKLQLQRSFEVSIEAGVIAREELSYIEHMARRRYLSWKMPSYDDGNSAP